jgi:branched-chain amino acid transport system substrate-binding protein
VPLPRTLFAAFLVNVAVLTTPAKAATPKTAASPKAGQRCAPTEVGRKVGVLICMKNGNVRTWEATRTAPASAPTAGRAASPASRSKDSIKLGIALGLTGAVTANLAQDQTLGVMLAEKYFNDKGGINGRRIELIIQDTTSDEAGAIAAFNALINSAKVVGIIGPSLSQQAFVADPIAERAKVPVLGPSNTAEGVPQIGDYVARVSAGVAAYAGLAIKFAAAQQPSEKAAVFFASDDAFSRNETVVFQNAVKTAGVELLPPQTFVSTDTDYAVQIAFVQSNKPDFIAISGLASAGNLVRKIRELGFKGPIVGGNGLNVTQTFAACKALCDGLILVQAYSPALPNDGINLDFRKMFKVEHQREPGQASALAFSGVQVFVEALIAIEKAGKLTQDLAATRVALNAQILAGQYLTPLGEISFDSVGEIQQKDFYIAQVRMLRGDTADTFSGTFSYTKVQV